MRAFSSLEEYLRLQTDTLSTAGVNTECKHADYRTEQTNRLHK
jgi:hypothetical protein